MCVCIYVCVINTIQYFGALLPSRYFGKYSC